MGSADSGECGPQAGDPVCSGVHFLSGEGTVAQNQTGPDQVSHTPTFTPATSPGVEPHLRCPERGKKNHCLKGPGPPVPRNSPLEDLYFERGLWVCVFPMYKCNACIARAIVCVHVCVLAVYFLCIWINRYILSVNSE